VRIVEVTIKAKRILRQPPQDFSSKRNPWTRIVVEVSDELHHAIQFNAQLFKDIAVCVELIQHIDNMMF